MRGKDPTVIIGAGPAGLACAYALAQAGRKSHVIEQDEEAGGLCRTIDFDGYLFDIGGHRFLSRSAEVNRLWRSLLDGDLLRVKRRSQIHYRGKFYGYPLAFSDTLRNLGPWESARCAWSYLAARVIRPGDDETFEAWVVNRFGKRLFRTFFDRYTQKVWGLPCDRLSSDWAKQRIQGMSLSVAVRDAVFMGGRDRPKTLYDEFLYPRRGPGQFTDRLKERCQRAGVTFLFKTKVTAVRHDGANIRSLGLSRGPGAEAATLAVDQVLSSMPATELAAALTPPPPPEVLAAAAGLRFRDFISVNVILDRAQVFPGQWIYIHSPEVGLSRVQNFKNWSPDMVRSADKTSLGLEYFCSRNDDLWRADDNDLIRLAVGEMQSIGLASAAHFRTGFVVRRENAYPVYDLDYNFRLSRLHGYLQRFSNFQAIGRAGLFRYGNSDLALLTGIRAAENLGGGGRTDLWSYDVGS